MTQRKPFGIHFILDADQCKGDLQDKKHIQSFIDTLVDKLDMKKKGETVFEYVITYNKVVKVRQRKLNKFFEDNPDIVGWSVVQIISLSNITIHINEISRTIYLDVFTCGDLDDSKVTLLVSDFFKPTKIKKQIIYRDARS